MHTDWSQFVANMTDNPTSEDIKLHIIIIITPTAQTTVSAGLNNDGSRAALRF